MLTITATPNQTGVKVSGDYFDLDELNQALYKVLGPEGKYMGYEGSRMRILGVSYEIRHAAQGDRNIEFIFNGLNEHVKKHKGMIAPDKNIYYSTEVLWPEIIYTAIALKDFIQLHLKEAGGTQWDPLLHVIARFQAVVLECLQGHVPEEEYKKVLEAFQAAPTVHDYATQYVDFLNLRYLDMTKDQREKNLGAIAFRLAVHDQDYMAFRKQVMAAAEPSKKSIHEIAINLEYPEQIEW